MELLIHPGVAVEIENLISRPQAARLFFGPAHVGKNSLALEVARILSCHGCEKKSCRSCIMAKNRSHPDIHQLQPDDKGKIGVHDVQLLHKQLSLARYYQGGVRTVIIKDADTLTTIAQNALLKIIEEPPSHTLFILTASDRSALLATIQSRCQSIFIGPLPPTVVSNYLQKHYGAPVLIANKACQVSGGRVGLAVQYFQAADLLEDRERMENIAKDMVSSSLFTRLLAASSLAVRKADIQELTQILQKCAKSLPPATISQNYVAIEMFRRRVAANVNPKTAYEALAVELTC